MRLFDLTQYGYWSTSPEKGSTNLSYGLLMVLTIIGGFFALDHLYLRSPISFVTKIIVNFLLFGLWWLYDILQVVFNKDSVKLFGLSIPGYGPAGIGAGMLAEEKAGTKHTTFLLYALALICGGMFGLDSFILGNKLTGIVRILLLISVIFSPLAVIWYIVNVGKFFFKTERVLEENAKYFGAPPPKSPFTSFLSSIPFVSTIMKFFKMPMEFLGEPIASAIGDLTDAVKDTTSVITGAEGIAKEAIRLGENVTEVGAEIAKNVGEAEATLSGLPALTSAVESVTSGVSVENLKNTMKQIGQTGGNISSGQSPMDGIMTYSLLGVFGFIVVSGLIVSFRRFRQNESDSSKGRNDTPPEPGNVRGINQVQPQ